VGMKYLMSGLNRVPTICIGVLGQPIMEMGKLFGQNFHHFSHVVNKHKDLENPVFDKCAHSAEIQTRKWLDKG